VKEETTMSLQQRLTRLEQAQTGDEGAGIMGVRNIHWETGLGPNLVIILQTGERMTEAEWRARYPRGLLILRQCYADTPPTGDEAA
jgi:hypothetical protein